MKPVAGVGSPSGLVPWVDLNPFAWAGDAVKRGLADAFTSMMMALWSAGLWLIQMVFDVLDRFVTPDLGAAGLGRLYGTTLWVSFVIALVIGLGQVGLAALRRDGRSMGTLVVGVAQYGAVVTVWVGVCTLLVLGCAGLTTGLLHQLLGVDHFSGYAASAGLPGRVTGTVQAAVLGLCALLLVVPAAFGYLLIMLVREASLLILTATMPLAAAGTLGEGTKAWLWRAMRWFLAACLTAPLLALVVGLGVQISRAAFPDAARHTAGVSSAGATAVADTSANVGMAVVGCVILLVACFCPMALFRLLAFVDPGTASGASFRSTMAANGGVSGLLGGRHGSAAHGSAAATQVASDGRSSSEDSADVETTRRFSSHAVRGMGLAGRTVGAAMDRAGSVASAGASMTVDVMGQAGVGHQGYYDTTPPPRRPRGAGGGRTGSGPRTRVGHGWDPHQGVAHDPAQLGFMPGSNVGEVDAAGPEGGAAGAAGEGAFLA